MRRVDTGYPDQLSYRAGGGCLAFFGLPFLLMGLLAAGTAAVGTLTAKGGGAAPLGARVMAVLFGLLFASIGAAFVFGRSGVLIDKSAGTIKHWLGLLFFPLYSRNFELKDFTTVTLSQEQRSSKNGKYNVYPVRLTGPDGAKVDFTVGTNELEGRKQAEELAKFLQLDLVDSLTGTPVTRSPDTLDESLREQVRRTGNEPTIVAPPAAMRATFSAEGNRVVFEVPPYLQPGLLLGLFAGGGFVVFVSLVFLLPILNDTNMDPTGKLIFGTFIGVGFIGLPLLSMLGLVVSQLRRRERVTADPEELLVTTRGLVFSKTERIAADKLEDLRLDRNTCLVAFSDEKSIRFGKGLPCEELTWIRTVILKALTTGAPAESVLDEKAG